MRAQQPFLDILTDHVYHKIMKRKPTKIEELTFIMKKLLAFPEFDTEEELIAWLEKEAAKPDHVVRAESRRIIREAREELKKCTYLC